MLICAFRGLQSNNKRAVFSAADLISMVVAFNVCIFFFGLALVKYNALSGAEPEYMRLSAEIFYLLSIFTVQTA